MEISTYTDRLLYTIKSTPTMQRIRQHFDLLPLTHVESDDGDGANDPLQTLLKQTWNIFGVSSLFGFDYESERHLKLYGKRLREEVASILPQDNVTYEAKVTIDESISPRPTVTDPPAIRIEVYTKNADKDNAEKCIYTGILISWGTSLAELDHEKSVKLPLLLCRGTKNTMTAVHITLGNMFDCQVVALPATEDDLRWLVPVILQPNELKETSSNKGQVKLEYKFPGLPVSNTIAVKYDSSVLTDLWTVICDNDESTLAETGISLKHVERFHEVLQHQMLQGGGMQLGLGKLNKINLPSFTIMENRMKAASSEVLTKILLFFNEKAIEVLHTLNLDLTMSTTSMAS